MTAPDVGRDGYALVDKYTGEILIVADIEHTIRFDPASPLGWMTAAAVALAQGGYGMRFLEWVPSDDGRYAMGVRKVDAATPPASGAPRCTATSFADAHPFERDEIRTDADGYDDWERCGRPAGDPLHTAGDPLAELHAAYTAWHDGDASSNDVDQALDDWLTARGFPTVMYRERPKRGRR